MAVKNTAIIALEVQWWGGIEELDEVIKPALAEALARTADGFEFAGERK